MYISSTQRWLTTSSAGAQGTRPRRRCAGCSAARHRLARFFTSGGRCTRTTCRQRSGALPRGGGCAGTRTRPWRSSGSQQRLVGRRPRTAANSMIGAGRTHKLITCTGSCERTSRLRPAQAPLADRLGRNVNFANALSASGTHHATNEKFSGGSLAFAEPAEGMA